MIIFMVSIFRHIDEVFSKIPVPSLQTTLQEILELTVKKRRASLHKGCDLYDI